MITKIKIINFCDLATTFFLGFIIYFISISIAATNIAIGFTVFFWLLKKILSKDFKLSYTPINKLLFLFFIICVISIFNAINVKSGIGGLEKLAKYLLIFFPLVETLTNKRRLNFVLWMALFGLCLVSIDGIVQYITGRDFLRGYEIGMHDWSWYALGQVKLGRLRASTHNPNDFAIYLVTVLPIFIVLCLYHFKNLFKKIFTCFVILIGLFCLFHTFSREGAIAFLISVSLLALLKKDKRIAIFLILVLLIGALVLPKEVKEWSLKQGSPLGFLVDASRRLHWQAALNMIKAHPFFGIGINNFCISYQSYKTSGDPFTLGWYAHNMYLNLAGEIGLIGFLVFFMILFRTIKNWWRSYLLNITKEVSIVSLAVFLGLVGYLISGIFESSLQYSNLAVLFWFVISLLTAITKMPLAK
ncbi:MAG: O-antigen ligase family protein [Candidatus Omnitrophota bacterium]